MESLEEIIFLLLNWYEFPSSLCMTHNITCFSYVSLLPPLLLPPLSLPPLSLPPLSLL